MHKIQNRISPLVAAAIIGALLCLPVLGNMSARTARLATHNKVMYTKMILEIKGVQAKHDKGHE